MKIAVDLTDHPQNWEVAGGVILYACEQDDVELVFPKARFLRAEAGDAESWDGLISDSPKHDLDIPQVVVSPIHGDPANIFVHISFSDAHKLVIRQFSAMGLCNLAFFTRPQGTLGWNVFSRQSRELGIEPVFIPVDESERMLKEIPKPCGIVANSVDLGIELLGVCSDLGLQVPGDVHVIVIGNSPKCLECTPTLSSVVLPHRDVGYRAAEACVNLMTGLPAESMVIRPTDLIIRDSVDVNNVRISTAAEIAQYLRSNFSYPLRMEDLQRRSAMSRRQLERLFRSVYGTSPIAYLNDLRYDHAKRMLESSGLPIKQIASECGYCSHTHFCRVFQNTAGTSPSDYRKQHSKK